MWMTVCMLGIVRPLQNVFLLVVPDLVSEYGFHFGTIHLLGKSIEQNDAPKSSESREEGVGVC